MHDLTAARLQMAISLAFHIIFAVVGIAMPLLMVIAEWRWQRTGEGAYLALAKRWAKGTAILFAGGAEPERVRRGPAHAGRGLRGDGHGRRGDPRVRAPAHARARRGPLPPARARDRARGRRRRVGRAAAHGARDRVGARRASAAEV